MTGEGNDENKIGYKKPPKKSQFKKGKSGNPKGRPNKKPFQGVFCDLVNEVMDIGIQGKTVKMTAKEAIIKKVIIDSMNGKPAATKNFIEMLKHLKDFYPV